MKKTAIAAAAASLCLVAAGAAPAALATTHHASHPAAAKKLATHLTKKGSKITVTATGALKGQAYYCVLTVTDGSSASAATLLSSLKTPVASKTGKLTCTQTFKPFKQVGLDGKTRHCPVSKSDKKAGFYCAVGLADKNTQGKKSVGIAKFTP